MYKKKKIIAIIPARVGSKRLPGKNIKDFLGKPLIAWTIEEARNSKYIDRIIVSTDNKNIAKISLRFGADMPFTRPKSLASDTASSETVIMHALDWLKRNEKAEYNYFVLLQPTAPLRTVYHIDKSIEKLIDNPKAGALVSVCELNHSYNSFKKINENGYLEAPIKITRYYRKNKHDNKLYAVNGAIYMANCRLFKKYRDFYKIGCLAFIMDNKFSIDIDDSDDWGYAQFLFRKQSAHSQTK